MSSSANPELTGKSGAVRGAASLRKPRGFRGGTAAALEVTGRRAGVRAGDSNPAGTKGSYGNGVAPRAGAWIETGSRTLTPRLSGSPPARGRGLKLILLAGIVTAIVSPPARGRGLKQSGENPAGKRVRSPPARGRGLKQFLAEHYRLPRRSPPARGRGLKRAVGQNRRRGLRSPPARGRGLKLSQSPAEQAARRRPPRGGVD